MSLQWDSIVIDCTDPLLVASFWSEALGLELHGPNHDNDLWLEPGSDCPDILFGQVPEVKSVRTAFTSTSVLATRPPRLSASSRSALDGSTLARVT